MDGIRTDSWQKTSGYYVYYSTDLSKSFAFRKQIEFVNPNVIYLNSMFSKTYSIKVIVELFRGSYNTKLFLAPRGMLKESALKEKHIKKFLYLTVAKILGLYEMVTFHATNEVESKEISKVFRGAKIFVIDNLPPAISSNLKYIKKHSSLIKMIFVGRVHPIKNLLFFFECLRISHTSVEMLVVGNIEDKAYFQLLKNSSESFSDTIKISFIGALEHNQIRNVLMNAHLFVLPTLGENYGHAIIEALSVGRPVLISDQTPWKNLSNYNAGWELPLNDRQAWIDKINEAAAWDQEAFDKHCEGALAYAKAHTNNEELVKKYIEMFGGVTTEGKEYH